MRRRTGDRHQQQAGDRREQQRDTGGQGAARPRNADPHRLVVLQDEDQQEQQDQRREDQADPDRAGAGRGQSTRDAGLSGGRRHRRTVADRTVHGPQARVRGGIRVRVGWTDQAVHGRPRFHRPRGRPRRVLRHVVPLAPHGPRPSVAVSRNRPNRARTIAGVARERRRMTWAGRGRACRQRPSRRMGRCGTPSQSKLGPAGAKPNPR